MRIYCENCNGKNDDYPAYEDMMSSHLENMCWNCYESFIDEFMKTQTYIDNKIKLGSEFFEIGFHTFLTKKIRDIKINKVLE